MEPGCYPRVNAALIQSNAALYISNNVILSLVGKFVTGTSSLVMDSVPAYQFQTADGGCITVNINDGCDFDPNVIEYDTTTNTSLMVFELVGMVTPIDNGSSLLFQVCLYTFYIIVYICDNIARGMYKERVLLNSFFKLE